MAHRICQERTRCTMCYSTAAEEKQVIFCVCSVYRMAHFALSLSLSLPLLGIIVHLPRGAVDSQYV